MVDTPSPSCIGYEESAPQIPDDTTDNDKDALVSGYLYRQIRPSSVERWSLGDPLSY